MAMARARTDAANGVPFRLLYSVRTPENAIYREELGNGISAGGVDVTWAYTRAAPQGWNGRVGRVDAASLAEAVWPVERMPVVYVCGPTGFVEHVADALVELGHDPRRVKTERFGGV
jgi:ferredoxin-NADP reductase